MIEETQGPVGRQPNETPLTRRQAAEFLTDNGFPTAYSTLEKLCSPAINKGPESFGAYGRKTLYLPSALLAWARARVRRSASGS